MAAHATAAGAAACARVARARAELRQWKGAPADGEAVARLARWDWLATPGVEAYMQARHALMIALAAEGSAPALAEAAEHGLDMLWLSRDDPLDLHCAVALLRWRQGRDREAWAHLCWAVRHRQPAAHARFGISNAFLRLDEPRWEDLLAAPPPPRPAEGQGHEPRRDVALLVAMALLKHEWWLRAARLRALLAGCYGGSASPLAALAAPQRGGAPLAARLAALLVPPGQGAALLAAGRERCDALRAHALALLERAHELDDLVLPALLEPSAPLELGEEREEPSECFNAAFLFEARWRDTPGAPQLLVEAMGGWDPKLERAPQPGFALSPAHPKLYELFVQGRAVAASPSVAALAGDLAGDEAGATHTRPARAAPATN